MHAGHYQVMQRLYCGRPHSLLYGTLEQFPCEFPGMDAP